MAAMESTGRCGADAVVLAGPHLHGPGLKAPQRPLSFMILPDDREQPQAFRRGQGGCGLVHDEDARLDGERLGDLDKLVSSRATAEAKLRPAALET